MYARSVSRHEFVVMTLFIARTLSAQQDVPIGPTPAIACGSEVYMLTLPTLGQTPQQIVVSRWKAGQVTNSTILKSSGDDTYAPLAIGSSPDGHLHVAFAHHARSNGTQATAKIMRVDFDNQKGSVIWESTSLQPRSFSVSSQGHIYIVGVTNNDNGIMRRGDATVNLLHIFEPAGKEVASLLPTRISNPKVGRGVIARSSFSLRANGNFIVNFDQVLVGRENYQNLIARSINEYSPQGSVVRTHEIPNLPEDSVIGSAVFDSQENLIMQVVTLNRHTRSDGQVGFGWRGSYVVKQDGPSVVQTRLLDFGSPLESLIGVLKDGTLLLRVSTAPGQYRLRFLKR